MRQHRTIIALLAVAAALTAGVVALAATGRLAFVGSADWLAFIPADRREWAGLPVVCGYFILFLGAVVVGLRRADRLGRVGMAGLVALVAALAFLLHVSTAQLTPGGATESVLALVPPKTNVFYDNARRFPSVGVFLRGYEDRAARSPARAEKTHPPGPELCYIALRGFYSSCPAVRNAVLRLDRLGPAGGLAVDSGPGELPDELRKLGVDADEAATARAVALTLQLLAFLAVVPAYLLGAGLVSRRAGLTAAAFVALIPSVHCFSPGLDQVYPFLAVMLAWLASVAVRRRGAVGLIAAFLFGYVLCKALLFSLAFAVVAALVALALIAAGVRRGGWAGLAAALRERAGPLAAAGVGFALVVAVFALTWDVNLFAVWLRCSRGNAEFNAASGRSFLASVLSNPVEYLAFVGVAAGCLCAAAWVRATVDAARRRAGVAALLVVCFAAVMTVLDIAGQNRGEVARLWMFTMPFAALAGAWWLEERRAPVWAVAALLAVQFAQTACFRVTLDALSLHAR